MKDQSFLFFSMRSTKARMKQTLTPAQLVIQTFGGVRATARRLGKTPGAVCKWALPIEKQGTGGRIPSNARAKILEIVKKEKIQLSSHELDYGRVIG